MGIRSTSYSWHVEKRKGYSKNKKTCFNCKYFDNDDKSCYKKNHYVLTNNAPYCSEYINNKQQLRGAYRQKAKGKLFPFGWWYLLQASKKNDTAAFYLIGIDPAYQGKGITAIVFREMFSTFKKHGVKYLETNPELAENKSIQTLWKEYDPVNHKRRMSFRKDL